MVMHVFARLAAVCAGPCLCGRVTTGYMCIEAKSIMRKLPGHVLREAARSTVLVVRLTLHTTYRVSEFRLANLLFLLQTRHNIS
jgi:hypothetical protein